MQKIRAGDRRRQIIACLAAGMALLALLRWPGSALGITLTSGQAATLVLGQPDFTTMDPRDIAIGLRFPMGVAIDPTSGKVFVADPQYGRVVRFANLAALSNGAGPEGVLGQPSLTTRWFQCTQTVMSSPAGLAFDAAGRLWVADSYCSRVLRFDNASSKPDGAPADGVLSHPHFNGNAGGWGPDWMNSPYDVAVDGAGRLWVADTMNHRVLRFDNAAGKPNGAPADGVLGQSDFNGHGAGTTQTTMQRPYGLEVDDAGRLWVSDTVNHRVLRFDNAAGKPNGAPADGVLGQPNFTSNTYSFGPDVYNEPRGIETDPSGRLYVANTFNHTVLWYDAAASKPNGASPDGRLGSLAGTSASRLINPNDVFYHAPSDTLWVADGSNNRVLRFESAIPPTSTPTRTPTLTPTPAPTNILTPTSPLTATPTSTPSASATPTSTPTDVPTGMIGGPQPRPPASARLFLPMVVRAR